MAEVLGKAVLELKAEKAGKAAVEERGKGQPPMLRYEDLRLSLEADPGRQEARYPLHQTFEADLIKARSPEGMEQTFLNVYELELIVPV